MSICSGVVSDLTDAIVCHVLGALGSFRGAPRHHNHLSAFFYQRSCPPPPLSVIHSLSWPPTRARSERGSCSHIPSSQPIPSHWRRRRLGKEQCWRGFFGVARSYPRHVSHAQRLRPRFAFYLLCFESPHSHPFQVSTRFPLKAVCFRLSSAI